MFSLSGDLCAKFCSPEQQTMRATKLSAVIFKDVIYIMSGNIKKYWTVLAIDMKDFF